MPINGSQITEAELREQFQRSGLAARGWTFDRAMANSSIKTSLTNAAMGQRNRMARQSLANPASHYVEKETAA